MPPSQAQTDFEQLLYLDTHYRVSVMPKVLSYVCGPRLLQSRVAHYFLSVARWWTCTIRTGMEF